MVRRVKIAHATAERSSPTLEVVWTVKVPDGETLFVPPTMPRMRPIVIMSWVPRNWSMWNILVEFELSVSTLHRFVSLSDRRRRGGRCLRTSARAGQGSQEAKARSRRNLE